MEFAGFGELLEHMAIVVESCDAVLEQGLRAVTKSLLKDTREKFGEYQSGAGPYPDWMPLAEVTKNDRVRLGFPEDEPLLRTGDLRDSYYAEVDGLEGGVGSDEEKALAHEVGNPLKNLPARSTLGIAFAENEQKLFELTGVSMEALIVAGNVTRSYSSMISQRD
jgi:hypothetical protein